jgi:hypothetical protein
LKTKQSNQLVINKQQAEVLTGGLAHFLDREDGGSMFPCNFDKLKSDDVT